MPWSECLPEAEPPLTATFQNERVQRNRPAVDLESVVDPERTEGRFPSDAEADRRAQRCQIDVARTREDVAAVDEADGADAPSQRLAQLRVEDDQAVAPECKPVFVEGVVRVRRGVPAAQGGGREAADRRVSTPPETFPLGHGFDPPLRPACP